MLIYLSQFTLYTTIFSRLFHHVGEIEDNSLIEKATSPTLRCANKTRSAYMESINELEATLKQTLGWDKSRIVCLVQILLGLIKVRTVNLKQLACCLANEAEIDSNYRRLQRFFAQVEFPRHVIARLLAGLFFYPMRLFICRWIGLTGNGENLTSTCLY